MSNETPGRDPVPGWGQPSPEPEPEEATAPWPAEATPAEATPAEATAPWPAEATPAEATPAEAPWPSEAETPAIPAPASEPPAAASAEPGPPWGAPEPAAPAPASPWASTPAGVPVQPAPPQPAPAQPAPAQPAWGAPPQGPAPQQPAPVPPWGAPPQGPAPQQPAPVPGWGAPPQQQPPGGWGGPPQQASGWAPGGPGAPGGPPVGWAPAPASSGNGCLKGCLIVGAIGVVLLIIGLAGLFFVGSQIADTMVNPDGTLKSCTLISDEDLSAALDTQAQALPLEGFWDATMGSFLDKRVLKDAEDCWITVESGVTTSATSDAATGRLAASSGGDASGAFRQEKEKANQDGYFAGDVSGLGDEAFCTDLSPMGSSGVLVRSGDRLVYVSLVTSGVGGGPETCAVSQQVAKRMLR